MKHRIFILMFACIGIMMSCKSKKDVVDQSASKTDLPKAYETALDKLVASIGIEGKTESKFRSIYQKYQEKRMAVKENGGKPSQMVKEVLQLRDEQNLKVKKILNDEQYQIYLEAIEDSKGRPAKTKIEQPVK